MIVDFSQFAAILVFFSSMIDTPITFYLFSRIYDVVGLNFIHFSVTGLVFLFIVYTGFVVV